MTFIPDIELVLPRPPSPAPFLARLETALSSATAHEPLDAEVHREPPESFIAAMSGAVTGARRTLHALTQRLSGTGHGIVGEFGGLHSEGKHLLEEGEAKRHACEESRAHLTSSVATSGAALSRFGGQASSAASELDDERDAAIQATEAFEADIRDDGEAVDSHHRAAHGALDGFNQALGGEHTSGLQSLFEGLTAGFTAFHRDGLVEPLKLAEQGGSDALRQLSQRADTHSQQFFSAVQSKSQDVGQVLGGDVLSKIGEAFETALQDAGRAILEEVVEHLVMAVAGAATAGILVELIPVLEALKAVLVAINACIDFLQSVFS